MIVIQKETFRIGCLILPPVTRSFQDDNKNIIKLNLQCTYSYFSVCAGFSTATWYT